MKNKYFPPNIDPHDFSLLAVLVGYACVGNYNVLEQNSIGNWLILVGDYLLTHSSQQELIEARMQNNNYNVNNKNNHIDHNEIDFLIDAIQKIHEELNNLKESK